MSGSKAHLLRQDTPLDIELAPLSYTLTPESPHKHKDSSKLPSFVFALIQDAFREARRDIKPAAPFYRFRNHQLWWRFIVCIWMVSLSVLLLFLSFMMNPKGTSPCRGDRDFFIDIDSDDNYISYVNNWWDFSGLFEVTLGWGTLDFTTAKLMDVAWDLVVGRGGQAIMSLIAWRVFTEYLEVSIATRPATYTTVWLLRFHQDTSVMSSLRLFMQFFRRGLASKTATWMMATTLSFILAFPTIAGSMTGYTTFNNAYIGSSDERLFPYQDVKPVAYVIHDGSRVPGFTDDYIVPWRSNTQRYGYDASGIRDNNNRTINETEFGGKTLQGKPLDISAYYLPGPFYWDLSNSENRTFNSNPYDNSTNILFVVGDDLYNSTELVQNGVCQPKKDESSVQRYQWGFSFLQLYFVTILLLMWSLALIFLWKDAHEMLKHNNRDVSSRDWKGLLDFTDMMKKQVEEAGIDINNLSDKQLNDEIQTILKGGSISSQDMPVHLFSLWCLLWERKWWVAFGISATVSTATEHKLRPYRYQSYDEDTGTGTLAASIVQFVPLYTIMCLSVTFAAGRTPKQRIFVFILASVLCTPFFFYSWRSRDLVLPGTCVGSCLAFAIGSTKGSRFVLFLVPFLCNYIIVFILHLRGFP
ncbi:hypothetical protein HYE67_011251 [Fusarium culmorum]|uniref:Uncharacterized protein n=1 Tax=Fusarium culmorum TaxID=5516 RepID=A0A7S8DI47_FUSCU|nr:hypothetical protein HYE67_011251 [Fusarium culmorum]